MFEDDDWRSSPDRHSASDALEMRPALLVKFFQRWGAACLALEDYDEAAVASKALDSPALTSLLSSPEDDDVFQDDLVSLWSSLVSQRWGVACSALEDYDQAAVAFSKALDSPALTSLLSSPEGDDVFQNDLVSLWGSVAQWAYETGQYEKAIEYSNKARQRNRHAVGVHRYLALAQAALGQEQAALETLQQAIWYEEPWDTRSRHALMEEYKIMVAASQEKGNDKKQEA